MLSKHLEEWVVSQSSREINCEEENIYYRILIPCSTRRGTRCEHFKQLNRHMIIREGGKEHYEGETLERKLATGKGLERPEER